MSTARGFIYGPKACETLARASRQQLLAALAELDEEDARTNRERNQDAVENAVDSSNRYGADKES